jgi:hypothetical protein
MKRESPFPEPGSGRDWRVYYMHLRERCDAHQESVLSRTRRYKLLASVLHIAIPLLSISVMILVTANAPHSIVAAAALATVLTVLTGLNSILEPVRRYLECVARGIELQEWRLDFEMQVDQLKDGDLAAQAACFREKNAQLSDIGRRMAGVPIPRQPS